MAQHSDTRSVSTSGSASSASGSASAATSSPATATGSSPATTTEDTSQGKTSISSAVVSKVTAIAAREIQGVHSMGGGMSRAFGALRERMPGSSSSSGASTSGVTVEVGETQAAIDLDIIVEYGVRIGELSRAIRKNIINAVEQMTGLQVTEVNIAVNDIYIPSEDSAGDEEAEEEPAAPRVQ